MTRNPNRRPTHPGTLLREVVLPEAGITQAELARRMGVSRLTVSEIIHEKRAVTADIAHRLGRVFGNGPRSCGSICRRLLICGKPSGLTAVSISGLSRFKQPDGAAIQSSPRLPRRRWSPGLT